MNIPTASLERYLLRTGSFPFFFKDKTKGRYEMITLLSKLFIKDCQQYKKPEVRLAYGILCGITGIFLNLLLFAGKLFAGIFSGSVAIFTDAFNNLSDAGSSIISMLGFHLAAQKPDSDHPFGHGRFEYISGLFVAVIIIIMGFELAKTSVGKILDPAPIDLQPLSLIILISSILIKLYMWYYNRLIGKRIDSSSMLATATDSISDTLATTAVLIAMLLSPIVALPLDGWCGLLVALFIMYSGIRTAKDTMSPLLGQPPAPELVEHIHQIVMAAPEVIGIHDLIVHDYGPGRQIISLHAEVSEDADFLLTHDIIDNIEHQLSEELGCDAVIHMDPIAFGDKATDEYRKKIANFLSRFHANISIHDFRMVKGATHTKLIFDVALPYSLQMSDAQIKDEIKRFVESFEGEYFAVIKIDRIHIK